jgi:hypothetical protein
MVTYTTEIAHVSTTAGRTVHIKIKFMIQLRSDQTATIHISIFRLSVSSIYTTKHLLHISSEKILTPYVTRTFIVTINKNSPLNRMVSKQNRVNILKPYHSHSHFNITLKSMQSLRNSFQQSEFPTKFLYAFIISSMEANSPAVTIVKFLTP